MKKLTLILVMFMITLQSFAFMHIGETVETFKNNINVGYTIKENIITIELEVVTVLYVFNDDSIITTVFTIPKHKTGIITSFELFDRDFTKTDGVWYNFENGSIYSITYMHDVDLDIYYFKIVKHE